jgi:hypothetical protein
MSDVLLSLSTLAFGVAVNLGICYFVSLASGAELNTVVLYYLLLGLVSVNRRASLLEATVSSIRAVFK